MLSLQGVDPHSSTTLTLKVTKNNDFDWIPNGFRLDPKKADYTLIEAVSLLAMMMALLPSCRMPPPREVGCGGRGPSH